MVRAKSKKNEVGLGHALMNDLFGRGKNTAMHRGNAQDGAIKRKDQNGNEYITNAKKEAEWVKMRSVTEQGPLDEFLSTAKLAGTDFTAKKMNKIEIIRTDQNNNPYLLSAAEERGVVRKQNAKRARLTVPRRPPWDENTTRQELAERENQSFLDWRRGMAELEEVDDLLMTPFERNIEVWKQLWRVIERSDLIVQIVDARNPLLYRCEDLEKYVKELDGGKKRNLLLVNKADMMTFEQRRAWAEWFTENGIAFRFFSAELAREMNRSRDDELSGDESWSEGTGNEAEEDEGSAFIDADEIEEELDGEDNMLAKEARKIQIQDEEGDEDEDEWADEETVDTTPRENESGTTLTIEEQTRILTTEDLEAVFLQHSPAVPAVSDEQTRKISIGLVGYPNVGKSSTINALLGAKKVSVSATPGKTKHFQTLHLSSQVILCDCPGLVFPNFATTKADLVCAGVLPIDQLREHTGPAALVAQRIPKHFMEALYGMKIITRPIEQGGNGIPTGPELMRAYARARGFSTQGKGQPDEKRAARSVLKDYVKGKLLFCHPPPTSPPMDPKEFNRDLYDFDHLPQKRRAQMAGTENPSLMDGDALPASQGEMSAILHKEFFAPGQGNGNIARPFHYKYSEQGKQLSGRKLRTMTALENDIDPADLKLNSKKHFKGNKMAAKKRKTGASGLDAARYDD